MRNVKKVILTLASVIALSQTAVANETVQLTTEATTALNAMLANNIADIKGPNPAQSADQTFAKLETQLQTNFLVAEAVRSLPQASKYKVIIAD